MNQEMLKSLTISEILAFLNILDSKGVAVTLPFPQDEKGLAQMETADLKRIHSHVRDLARTPTGSQ